MPQVMIPATHFTHNVKKNYQDHETALIREFLQNSVDAGSSDIFFEFNKQERILTVSDDGCGMNRDILVNALLTMSGSHKGSNSIGGFGAAKEILLFQHEWYKVSTNAGYGDGVISVVGKQLDYDFTDEHLLTGLGTVFKIKFHQDYDLDSFENHAIDYLTQCDVPQNVYWNETLIESKAVCGNIVDKNIDWANIYCTEKSTNWAIVRINGVKMFEIYVESEYEIIIEITKPSTEILTVNRDGFTWSYQHQLHKLIGQIAVDKGQFGKAYLLHKIWHGNNNSYDDLEFNFDILMDDPKFADSEYKNYKNEINVMAAKLKEFVKNCDRNKIVKVDEFIRESNESIPDNLIDSMIARANDQICDHLADFYIKVTGKGIDKIPEHLVPGKWGKRTMSWAKLWKHCLKIVMKASGINVNYAIGWVIDNDEKIEALYSNNDGIHVFYMNPLMTWMKSSNHCNTFMKCLLNACHEVAHIFHNYHDESFSNQCENLILRSLSYINKTNNSWWKEYLDSKNEII